MSKAILRTKKISKVVKTISATALLLLFTLIAVAMSGLKAEAAGSDGLQLMFYKKKVRIQNPYDFNYTIYNSLTPLEKQLNDVYIKYPVGTKLSIKAPSVSIINDFLNSYTYKVGDNTYGNTVNPDGTISFATVVLKQEGDFWIQTITITDAKKQYAQAAYTATAKPAFVKLMEYAYDNVVAAGVNNNMTQLEAYNAIKAYIESRVDYDYNDKNWKWTEMLKTGKGICHAYAEALVAMCTIAGIPCEYVVSKDMDHAWNRIRLNGNWYWVDVTWDDVEPGEGYNGSKTLWADHTYSDITEYDLKDSIYSVFRIH